MISVKMLFQEIWFRKLNFALSLLAVTVAVAAFVAGPTLIDGYARETQQQVATLEEQTAAQLSQMEDETRKLMLGMGFNLMIVHRDTNMSDFWASDFSTVDMPQEYVDRLAQAEQLTLVTHLVATLQQRIDWNQRKVLLIGYLPETPRPHEHKKPMGYQIEPGTLYLGYELGRDHEAGDSVEVLGREFRVAQVLPERGSKDDITIAMHLSDAQAILNKPERINQILAIGCRCAGERLPKIRAQLEHVLPETHITEFQSIALARAEQRDLVAAERERTVADLAAYRGDQQDRLQRFAELVTPALVLASAVWVGLLALSNVRERRTEIGLLRALGARSWVIGLLFLGKAVLLGLVGAVLGGLVGTLAAKSLLPQIDVSPEHFVAARDVLLWSLLGTPVLCAMASYLPTLSALLQDPAIVLRDT